MIVELIVAYIGAKLVYLAVRLVRSELKLRRMRKLAFSETTTRG